jgi:hypothetical protein
MKNIFIKKAIAAALTAITLLGVLPMASSAATKTGWMKDSNGVWYYFNSDGVMQKDTTVTTNGHKYKLGSDGAWIQNYGSSAKGVESGAIYKIINVGSGKALDVYAAGTNNYANVDIYEDNNTDAQKWIISQYPDGTFKLININSKKALDVYAGKKDNYTNVDIYTDNATSAQKWDIIASYDGTYKLINVGSGKVLDVYGGGSTNYTNVQVYTDNGTDAQKWKLVRVG